MLQVKTQDKSRVLSITNAATDTAKRLLFDSKVHVNEIVMSRNFIGLNVSSFKESKSLQSYTRLFYRACRGRCRFHLAHFTAQYVISCAKVARECNSTHVSSLAGIDKKLEPDGGIVFVDFRNTGHFGKVIALVTQTPDQVLFSGGYQLLRVNLSRLYQQETL